MVSGRMTPKFPSKSNVLRLHEVAWAPLHRLKPALHTLPQRTPSQLAWPLAPGLGQAVHAEAPHELTLVFATHWPEQS